MKTAARVQLVVCGLGGQGAVFLSRVLAGAAIEEGTDVLTSETHGMAQRGGAVESHLKFGDFKGCVVRPGQADVALVLDESRLAAAQRFLRAGGACFVNAKRKDEGHTRCCDAFGVAKEIGNPRATNLVLLGYAAAARPDLVPGREACLAALERLSPSPVRGPNVTAFERGCALAQP